MKKNSISQPSVFVEEIFGLYHGFPREVAVLFPFDATPQLEQYLNGFKPMRDPKGGVTLSVLGYFDCRRVWVRVPSIEGRFEASFPIKPEDFPLSARSQIQELLPEQSYVRDEVVLHHLTVQKR